MKGGRAQERIQTGLSLEATGQKRKAEKQYRAALEIAPGNSTALIHLGLLLYARGDFAGAASLFRRASLADPQDAISRVNLAAALDGVGDEAGSTAALSEALAADPSQSQARSVLARRLMFQGRLTEARGHYLALLARDPTDGVARWHLAALDGLAGNLDGAFAGFAHEFTMTSPDLPRHMKRWRGEALAGRTLVVEAEQGLGDTIMFSRLAPLARQAGARVMIRPQSELIGLLSRTDLADVYVGRNEPARAHAWCRLLDLPAVFGTARSLAAAPGAYLTADPARCAAWSTRLPRGRRFRVGLVWAGSPTHPQDRDRSLELQALLGSLRAVPEVELVSLQKGPQAAQAEGAGLTRADLDIADFEDTAAALTQLDLLITVDTSVLHLAGALGLPVWGLIAFVPDWRWMMGRDDSPWYPTLRLFRQPKPGDWQAVAEAVAAALAFQLGDRGRAA